MTTQGMTLRKSATCPRQLRRATRSMYPCRASKGRGCLQRLIRTLSRSWRLRRQVDRVERAATSPRAPDQSSVVPPRPRPTPRTTIVLSVAAMGSRCPPTLIIITSTIRAPQSRSGSGGSARRAGRRVADLVTANAPRRRPLVDTPLARRCARSSVRASSTRPRLPPPAAAGASTPTPTRSRGPVEAEGRMTACRPCRPVCRTSDPCTNSPRRRRWLLRWVRARRGSTLPRLLLRSHHLPLHHNGTSPPRRHATWA